MHANFKLSGNGEYLSLEYPSGNALLDVIEFDEQVADLSTGRYPNGDGPFTFMAPTFSAANATSSTEQERSDNSFIVYPNPVVDACTVISARHNAAPLRLYSSDGILVDEWTMKAHTQEVNLSAYPSGLYTLLLYTKDQSYSKLLFKI